jgi:hypothetical protein
MSSRSHTLARLSRNWAQTPDPAPHERNQRLSRLAAALTAITCAVLASAAIVPAASARILPPNDVPVVPEPTVRVVTVGGITGWQIALIAIGAALVAAIAAVALDRARAVRKAASATAVTRPVWP